MMIDVSDRIPIDQGKLRQFCRKWDAQELSLFGSVLRDDFGDASDVDVLVAFRPGARHTIFDVIRMEEELSELLNRKVDLVEKRAIERSENHFRRRAILDNSQVLIDVE